jgi:hypothetical protein
MVMMCRGGAVTVTQKVQFAGGHAAISYSDYDDTVNNGGLLQFPRSIHDTLNFWTLCPGARIRFTTSSQFFTFRFYFNGLQITSVANGTFGVYANGAKFGVYPFGLVTIFDTVRSFTVDFGSSASRNVEILMPQHVSVMFVSIDLPAGQTMTASPAPPAFRLGIWGDSIAEGYDADDITTTWATLMRQSLNCQIVNMGFASRGTVAPNGDPAGDGTAMANLGCNGIIAIMGANSAPARVTAGAKADYLAFIRAVRLIQPRPPAAGGVKISVWKLFPNPTASGGGSENAAYGLYRTGQQQAVDDAVSIDGEVVTVAGPTASPTASMQICDATTFISASNAAYWGSLGAGPHPSNLGHSVIAPAAVTAVRTFFGL